VLARVDACQSLTQLVEQALRRILIRTPDRLPTKRSLELTLQGAYSTWSNAIVPMRELLNTLRAAWTVKMGRL